MLREIIRIDEERCTGCGECIPNCPEGALQIVNGKAKLVGDLLCDGLGACIGHCPEGAISVEIREAEEYDELKVIANVAKEGPAVLKEHLEHLRQHGQAEYFSLAVNYLDEHGIDNPLRDSLHVISASHAAACGCPGSRVIDLRTEQVPAPAAPIEAGAARPSRLRQWPVQIALVPPTAPYLEGADILIAADCVPFAYASFHEELLTGKVLLVGCPKLDDAASYERKIADILRCNDIRSVTVAFMEVPCCKGMVRIARTAVGASGRDIAIDTFKLSIRGDMSGAPPGSDLTIRSGRR